MGARLDDPAGVDDDDPVCLHRGGQPVGDQDGGAGREQDVERRLDLRLGQQVEVGGRLVEHEHPGMREERPRERDQLALAGGQRLAALVHDRVEAVGHPLDDIAQADGVDRLPDLVVGGVGVGEGDVVAKAAGEQERLLRHHAQLAAQRLDRDLAKVVAVDQDAALGRGRRSG